MLYTFSPLTSFPRYAYVDLLTDADTLLKTDSAFLLGPWLASAVQWGGNNTDCTAVGYEEAVKDCDGFYEWNARVQLTTWNPTPKTATKIPGGPIDYASKHWSGLIRDYYGARATLLQDHAYTSATAGKAIVQADVDLLLAQHAYVVKEKRHTLLYSVAGCNRPSFFSALLCSSDSTLFHRLPSLSSTVSHYLPLPLSPPLCLSGTTGRRAATRTLRQCQGITSPCRRRLTRNTARTSVRARRCKKRGWRRHVASRENNTSTVSYCILHHA